MALTTKLQKQQELKNNKTRREQPSIGNPTRRPTSVYECDVTPIAQSEFPLSFSENIGVHILRLKHYRESCDSITMRAIYFTRSR